MDALLTIENLHTHFNLDEGIVRAVDGVNLTIKRGQTLCLVGESGCGKSITAFSILRLISPPGKIVGGNITYYPDNKKPPHPDSSGGLGVRVNITDLDDDGEDIRRIRGKEIAMIFQEPMTSMSPVHTVGNQLMEAVALHLKLPRNEAKEHTIRMMERVGIPDAARRFDEFPHEMSGGLRQRAMIAMALVCRPALLIADEPTTALDVTIQAQILALMRELQQEFGMAILLITHDLGVVAEIAEEVAVMYLGRIVEQADVNSLFADPQHPYTQALMRSIPGRAERKTALAVISGSVPDALASIPGCPFHPRCAECVPGLCDQGDRPPLAALHEGHYVACFVREQTPVRSTNG